MSLVVWIIAGVALLAAFLYWYIKTRVMQDVRFTEEVIKAGVFFYKDIKVHYHHMLPEYNKLDAITAKSPELSALERDGKMCKMSVFFDNPGQTADPTQCRACEGYYISPKEEAHAVEAQLKAVGLERAEIPECRTVRTEIKRMDRFSAVFGAMRAYPSLFRHLAANKEKYQNAYTPVVEMHFLPAIVYAAPLGEEKKAFQLTRHPTPAPKGKAKTE